MPELPEVETTRSGIAPFIEDQIVSQVIVRDNRLRWPVTADLNNILVGKTIIAVKRRAKYLLLETDKGTLLMHLGMSGRLQVLSEFLPAAKHDHVDIAFANGITLRFTDPRRFGAVLWTDTDPALHSLIKDLGPEPLSDGFNGAYLFQRSRQRQVNIKTFIMNAKVVVGVGNIYASESCFMAGIHPQIIAGKLTRKQADKLAECIKIVLDKAIAAGGTTLRDFRDSQGNPGYFAQELLVYARADMACRQCGHPIELIRQVNRATYFCPICQKR